MKFIKSYEELKYTADHKKLIGKLRYALNKIFASKKYEYGCGVFKVRNIKDDLLSYKNNYNFEYTEYTGSTMLFSIYIPVGMLSEEHEKKRVEKFKKIANEIGLVKEYDFDDGNYYGTQEQMEELINRLKYLIVEVDAEKYNI